LFFLKGVSGKQYLHGWFSQVCRKIKCKVLLSTKLQGKAYGMQVLKGYS
jgi:hypothetical protein